MGHSRSTRRHNAAGHRQLDLAAPGRRLRSRPPYPARDRNLTYRAQRRDRQRRRHVLRADAAAPRLVDLSTPLTADTQLALITERDPEALKVVRHSAAHVMATAVLELFPETKLGHGPATDQGFFYDFYREKPFTPEDLAAIEAKMAEVVARDEKFVANRCLASKLWLNSKKTATS
jgi:hypothetical protein